MSWVKVKEISVIKDKLFHETLVLIRLFAEENGRENQEYRRQYANLHEMITKLKDTNNIVIPILVDLEVPVIVLLELDMLNDGKNYRVTNFLDKEEGEGNYYVELVSSE